MKIEDYELIGPHVRHIIEHYRTLINSSLSNSYTVNYENKERDLELEINSFYAAATLLKIDDVIQQIERSRTCLVDDNYISTYGREAAYCEDHAIHHMAIIRYILKEHGIEDLVDDKFGVAPSTIKYRESQ